jgi:error-prone DNA polymerase
MSSDYLLMGLSPAAHPMALIRPSLHEGILPTTGLAGLPDGTFVNVAGMIVVRQRPGTAKGFVFLLMEDEHGLVNIVVKPDLYDRERLLMRKEPFLIIGGRVQKSGSLNLIAERVQPLPFRTRRQAGLPNFDDESEESQPSDRAMLTLVAPPARNFH